MSLKAPWHLIHTWLLLCGMGMGRNTGHENTTINGSLRQRKTHQYVRQDTETWEISNLLESVRQTTESWETYMRQETQKWELKQSQSTVRQSIESGEPSRPPHLQYIRQNIERLELPSTRLQSTRQNIESLKPSTHLQSMTHDIESLESSTQLHSMRQNIKSLDSSTHQQSIRQSIENWETSTHSQPMRQLSYNPVHHVPPKTRTHLHGVIRVYSAIKSLYCEGEVYFAPGQVLSYHFGWFVDIPDLGKGAACQPPDQTYPNHNIIPFIKRGGCRFIDKAMNSGANFSIIYDNMDRDDIVYMDGFGKLSH